jgi:proteasome activator subunit 4
VSEPTLATELLRKLFACQHNEKVIIRPNLVPPAEKPPCVQPSIQSCVSSLSDNCLNGFAEPNHVVYNVENVSLNVALKNLRAAVECRGKDGDVLLRCTEQRVKRLRLVDEATEATVRIWPV